MGEAVLVFPAGMPEGLAYRDQAKAKGLRVVGASSLERDPAKDGYETWEHLPNVSDPAFDAAFAEVVRRHDVGAVHAPHFIIWKHLSERLGQIAPGARLTGAQGPQDNERAYRALRERVGALKAPCFWPATPPRRPLSALERTGLIRLADAIPGLCGEEKMVAFMEAMRHAPTGDVVEIGAWWGRTAALLVWLARRYEIGRALCIDPWLVDALAQGAPMVDEVSAELDTEEALRIFEINLAPIAEGRLNYLRTRSAAAAALYGPGLTVETDAFGRTRYEGHVALLHIDGNHAEAEVAQDCALWTPHVAPGGWIVFDDYEWAFGDGPRRAADAFVAAEDGRIAARFQAGGALFLQLRR
ncbi:MAG: class I SAM-dependent methyltransferase [Caulobacterales bacterium]